ncbi:helix-turn-helix domain-containing protein [Cellulophaga lytica]|uniref:helix-turn-helix domain-containing protein n=1 Tax=Cellulophaga lytica TaxID=979 RepID=UPI002015EF26|nr:helix-turn-helix transcriptional regulator [Cellulophaga lytica]
MKDSEINKLIKKTRYNLGVKIKEIRESKNLTQVDLASRIEGRFYTFNVSRIKSGRINTIVFTLFRIAKALNINISDLLDIEVFED